MKWETEIKKVIEGIPDTPYSWTVEAKHGCTEDMYWQGKRIMKVGDPVRVYCCGYVMEVFMKTLKKFKDEKEIPVSVMQEALRYSFLYTDKEDYVEKGLPGFLIDQGWATKVGHPRELRYGDIAQAWWDWPSSKESGHSVIATGFFKKDDVPCLDTIGANSTPKPGGIVKDWWYWRKNSRRWLVARMKPEWLGASGKTIEERVATLENQMKNIK